MAEPISALRKRRAARGSAVPPAPTFSLWLATAALAILFALAFVGPAVNIYTTGGTENTIRQIGYFVCLGAAMLAMDPRRQPLRLFAVPWPIVVALGWCWLSLGWSIDPSASVRKLVLLTLALWSMFLLVRRLGYARTLAVARVALVVLLVVNYVVVFVYPSYGIHQSEDPVDGALNGAWRGFMGHKNGAGLVCAITFLVFAFDRRRVPVAAQVAVCAAALLFLALTQSKTSMGIGVAATVLGLVVMAVYAGVRARGGLSARAAAIAAAVAFVVPAATLLYLTFNPAVPMGWFADPEGLTGRLTIWQPLLRYYVAHSMFGAGYGAFWTQTPSSPIYQYATGWVTGIFTGHNGFFDLLNTVGLSGLLLVLFAVLAWPLRQLLLTPRLEPAAAGLIAALVIFCLGENGTESSLFDRDALGQVFLMLAIALLWSASGAWDGAARFGAFSQRLRRPPARR